MIVYDRYDSKQLLATLLREFLPCRWQIGACSVRQFGTTADGSANHRADESTMADEALTVPQEDPPLPSGADQPREQCVAWSGSGQVPGVGVWIRFNLIHAAGGQDRSVLPFEQLQR